MWPILACSVIAIAVFAERLFYLHRATIHVGEFLQGLSNLVQRRNFAEALHESAGTPGPVARVIHAAIIRHEAPARGTARDRAGSRATRSAEAGTFSRRPRHAGLSGAAARPARHGRRNDRRLRHALLERRVRDRDGTFQRRLQKFAHDRGRPRRRDADFRRLQLPFFPREHVDARNGAGRDRSGAHVDRPRADERHHHLPGAG